MDDKELEKLQNSLNALDDLNSNEVKKESTDPIKFEDIEDIENADISDEQLLTLLEMTLAEELMSLEEEAVDDEYKLDLSPEEVFVEETVKLEPQRAVIDSKKEVASSIPSEEAILDNTPQVVKVETPVIEEPVIEAPKVEVKEAPKEEVKEDLESILAKTLEEAQKEAPGDKNALDEVERSLLASIVESAAENEAKEAKIEAQEKKKKVPKVKKVRGSKPKKNKKGKGFIIVASIGAIAAAAAGFFIAQRFMPEEIEPLFVDSIKISSPNVITSNSSNFIFVREEREAGQNNFTLERIVIDSMNTTFIFNNEINWDNFSVSLVDNLGREYYIHHSFFANTHPNTLIFESLRSDALGAVLTITEYETNETATFPLEFVGNIIMTPASHMYLNSTVNISGTDFSVTGGYFTPVKSVIYYTVRGSYIPNIESLFLTHGASNLPVIHHESFNLGALNLGRVEFPALNNLSGTAQVRFPETVIYRPMHTILDVTGLLANTPENEITIETDNGVLILSRMLRRQRDFLMVLEGRDTYGNLIETRPNASLVLHTDGGEVVLEPEIFSGPQGSDIIFSMPSGGGLPSGISQISLRLYGIYFASEPVSINIDLDNLLPSPHVSDSIAITAAANHLTAKGYHSATPIAYKRDGLNFYGVFSTRFHDIVTIYTVIGENTHENVWQFSDNVEDVWFR